MGALMEAYNKAKTKAQIPETSALPEGYAPAYYEAMGKPYQAPKTPDVGDIFTTGKEYYKKAGGGIKGVGSAILAGLGKVGEVMGTETGQNILAGTSSNPYLAQGYLSGAERARGKEATGASRAFEANLAQMKQKGEDVREAEKAKAAAKQSEANLLLQNELNAPQLAISQGQLDLARENALLGRKEKEEEPVIKNLSANDIPIYRQFGQYFKVESPSGISGKYLGGKATLKQTTPIPFKSQSDIPANLPTGTIVVVNGKKFTWSQE